ncbi:MAG: rubrerythrin family protein [Anaerolineae bacterium]|nr:rubrerythrin family protein [Anaerolineae bacterium]
MKLMTKDNLQAAFAGESQAHMKYLIFADQAEKEGFPDVARLFRAIAFAEQVHATNHFRTLGKIGQTAENLQAGIDGETYEVNEMYPAFRAVAELQEEKGANRSMSWALEAEKVHAGMYEQARQAVLSGKDAEVGEVYICEVCGWTVEGELPERCPICGARKEKFRRF